MIINHNMNSINTLNQVSRTDSAMGTALERLSSGKRINKAADDAAGLAISQKMTAQIRGLNMAKRNSMDGTSLIQTAEGGLTEIQSMLQRMRELTVQASNGTYQATDKTNIQSEMNQLIQQIDDIATKTNFNGQALLTGTSFDIQTGSNNGDKLTVAIASAKKTSLGTGANHMDGTTANSVVKDISLVDITDSSKLEEDMTTIDKAIQDVSNNRANLGAYQNRLEHTMNNLTTSSENLTSAESRIEDTDMASTMSEFTKQQVLMQAGISMASQANQKSQYVLKLLG